MSAARQCSAVQLAAAFLTDGEDAWYRTGDLVREEPDGNLIFLGRRDLGWNWKVLRGLRGRLSVHELAADFEELSFDLHEDLDDLGIELESGLLLNRLHTDVMREGRLVTGRRAVHVHVARSAAVESSDFCHAQRLVQFRKPVISFVEPS